MSIPGSLIVFLTFLSSVDFLIASSMMEAWPPKSKPQKPRGKPAAQVQSQPKGRSMGSASYGQSASPVVPGSIVEGKNGEGTHFLDFPPDPMRDDDSPLHDFPDPIETMWNLRNADYNSSCQREAGDKRKEQEAKRIQALHKPFVAHEVKTQNRLLQQAILHHFVQNVSIPNHHPDRGWKLLDESAAVFESFCKKRKHLPTNFISNAVYVFKKLHYLTTPSRTEFLKPEEYTWISDSLKKCGSESKGFNFFLDKCEEDILAWKKEGNWLCTNWKDDLNLPAYDPLLDIIWHLYNGVYFYCYKHYFEDSYFMAHKYSHAIMDLYTLAIKMRWKHQLESEEFWTRILGPHFLVHAKNVERCAQAAVEREEMQVYKPRYTSPNSMRPPNPEDDDATEPPDSEP